jgi:hypothetical protein
MTSAVRRALGVITLGLAIMVMADAAAARPMFRAGDARFQPPVPAPPADLAEMNARLSAKRDEIDGELEACLASGWGWRAEYNLMTMGEARLRAESLGAAHRQRALVFQACHRSLREKVDELRGMSAHAARTLSALGPEDPRLAALADLLQQVPARLARTVEDLLPRLVTLEHAVADHFTRLRAFPSRPGDIRVSPPPLIERLEAGVVRAVRRDVIFARAEVEALYRVHPVPAVAALMATVRIQEEIATVVDRIHGPDASDSLERFVDLREGLRRAGKMVVEAAANRQTVELFPAAAQHYAAALANLIAMHEHVETLLGLGGMADTRTRERAIEAAEELRRLVTEIERAGARVDSELQTLTRIFLAALAAGASSAR